MSNDRVKKDCIGDTQRPPVVLQPRLIAWGLVPFGPSHCHPPSHCSLCPGHGQHTPIHRRFLVTVPSCVQSGGLLERLAVTYNTVTKPTESRHGLGSWEDNDAESDRVTVCAVRVAVGPCQAGGWCTVHPRPSRGLQRWQCAVRRALCALSHSDCS